MLHEEDGTLHYHAGGDITSGFPLSTSNKILEECNLVLTRGEFGSRYAFYERSLEDREFELVSSLLAHCTVEDAAQHSSSESDTTITCVSSAAADCQRPVLFSSSSDSD